MMFMKEKFLLKESTKGDISLEMVGKVVFLVIGIGVVTSILINQFDIDTGHPVQSSVDNAEYPVCTHFRGSESISRYDLKTIVYGLYSGNCEEGVTVLTESPISREFFEQFLVDVGIKDSDENPLVVYGIDSCDSHVIDGVAVETDDVDPGRMIIPSEESIEIKKEGGTVLICEDGS